MDSGSDSPTYQTTTANNAPWSGVQPALTETIPMVTQQVRDRPLSYFPGSTVVPYSPQTTQALGLMESRALAGNPIEGQAQGEAGKVLAGDYLTGGNPAYQGMVERSIAPLRQEFQNTVVPGVNSAFAGRGRTGSNMQKEALGTAADRYMRQVGDVTSGLAYQNYGDERSRMAGTMALAPSLAQGDYYDIAQLGNVGSALESQSQAQLSDEVNRFNFGQQEPIQRLATTLGLLNGGYGGQTQQSTVQQGGAGSAWNPVLGTLGGAATTAGIMSSLFGGQNPVFNKFW
jgi:hypothetical protein